MCESVWGGEGVLWEPRGLARAPLSRTGRGSLLCFWAVVTPVCSNYISIADIILHQGPSICIIILTCSHKRV